ncbi:DEKNAAC100428 [Brettanomyces naardenensis]|uniref:DEKNAAC100428 n=1 Tax=Brettanomyces naardenensis TaxID=13370 RepID=A0A448YFG5_BRENA|nr:DEKNAAC100428 [Brettanomyces naardenensis]
MAPRKNRGRSRDQKYFTIKGREASFETCMVNGVMMKWPHNDDLSPEEMAAVGFYYDPTFQHQDCVSCFYCKKKEYDWKPEQITMDDGIQPKPAIIKHLERSPDCANARILCARFECEHSKDFHWERDDLFRDPVVSSETRLKTFVGWPFDIQRKVKNGKLKGSNDTGYPSSRELSENGFYYLGYDVGDDAVTCLYCGVSLEGWEEGDSVSEEHKSRSPDCYMFHYKEKMQEYERAAKGDEGVRMSPKSSSLYRLSLVQKKDNSRQLANPFHDNATTASVVDFNDVEIGDDAEEPFILSDGETPDGQQVARHKGTVQSFENSLKIDNHGLTYEEIPDEGYLDDPGTKDLEPSEPVEIPASSINELSDFYIEPSASGPSTFFKKSRRTSENSSLEKGPEVSGRVNVPEPIEEVQNNEIDDVSVNDIPDFEDVGVLKDSVLPPVDNPVIVDDQRNVFLNPGETNKVQDKSQELQLVVRGVQPSMDSQRDLVDAIKDQVRQEIIRQMAIIKDTVGGEITKDIVGVKKIKEKNRKRHHKKHRKEAKARAEDRKRERKGHKKKEKKVEIDKQMKPGRVVEVKKETMDAIHEVLPEEKAPREQGAKDEAPSGGLGTDVKKEKDEKEGKEDETPRCETKHDQTLISNDSRSILPLKRQSRSMERPSKNHKRARKALDGSLILSDDPLSFTGKNSAHLKKYFSKKLGKVQEMEGVTDSGEVEEYGRREAEQEIKGEEQGQDLKEGLEKENSEEKLKEKQEEQSGDEAQLEEHSGTGFKEPKEDTDDEILLDNHVLPSDDLEVMNVYQDKHAYLRSSPVTTDTVIAQFSDDYVATVVDPREVREEIALEEDKENMFQSPTKQSTPFSYATGTLRMLESSPSKTQRQLSQVLERELKGKMGNAENGIQETRPPEEAPEPIEAENESTKDEPSLVLTDTTDSTSVWERIDTKDTRRYCTDLEEAATYLRELINSEYRVLSEDMDGRLTNFIAEMPPEELAMTIKEWLEHRAEQAVVVVRQKTVAMKRQFRIDAARALAALENIPCELADQ